MKTSPVKTGLDCLVAGGFQSIRGARVGVLTNQAAVDCELQHLVDILLSGGSCKLQKLFAPEHGFRGSLQDMEQVQHTTDSRTGLPIISLYGTAPESLYPKESDFSDIDILLIDLQDIGTRYYTYTQTLAFCMKVASKAGIKVVVLDRPNPLGGQLIEGALLTNAYHSFCGYASVANRHGLTIGELATLMHRGVRVNGGFPQAGTGDGQNPDTNDDLISGIDCELEIIKLQGWKRQMYFDDTHLPWILPSPNMPTLETALVYPGSCLFECTSISEGRGTTKPFELLGAPYIDGFSWADAVLQEGTSFGIIAAKGQQKQLAGVVLRPSWFVPKFHKFANILCGGLQIHVTNRKIFQPFRLGLALLSALRKLYPKQFSWRKGPYEFIENTPAIDLLFGNSSFRVCLESGDDLATVVAEMETFEGWYREAREEFLMY